MVDHAVEAEELQALLDHELTPARQAEVERHLAECRACAALLEELRRVSATLQQWQVEPAPGSLRPPGIESEREGRWWWRWQGGLGLAAAAAVVLVIAAASIPSLYRARLTSQTTEVAAPAPPATPQPAAAPPAPSEGGERVGTAEPPTNARDYLHFKTLPSSRQAAEAEKSVVGGVVRERKGGEAAAGAAAEAQQDRLNAGVPAETSMASKREAPRETHEAEGRAGIVAEENRTKGALVATAPRDQAAATLQRRDMAAPAVSNQLRASAPQLIAYEASLSLEVKDFDAAKKKVESVVQESGGYVAEASSGETPGQARFADYTLRVPSEELSAVMDALRVLGRVKSENLTSEEVTDQVVDLDARLRNARAAEERLVALLKERTGKVRDVLEVEREIASTRGDIERMEARRQYLMGRVTLSTLNVTLVEDFKAQLQPAPSGTATRLHNAFVEGYENFAATLFGVVFFLARYGLSLLVWGGLLWLSGRLAWRAFQRCYRWA